MECLLLRHGPAVDWSEWTGDDHARPLTDDGITRARHVAHGLVALGIAPTHLLCSPFLRTRHTADIMRDVLGVSVPPQPCDALLSGASPDDFLNVLTAYAAHDRVLCVGHEPHLGHTVGVMVFGHPVEGLSFQPAGACGIHVHHHPGRGTGTLQWWLSPAQLITLGRR